MMTRQTIDHTDAIVSADSAADENAETNDDRRQEPTASRARKEHPSDGVDPVNDNDQAGVHEASARNRRSVTFSVRGLILATLITVLAVAVGTLGWLYFDARNQLAAQASSAAEDSRAEQLALDYAVNAATMDYKDLQGWKVKLVAGTSPELNKKLSEAADSMEQVLGPLEWTSTAEPLVASVRSKTDGVVTVDCFVSVQTKTIQAEQPLQSTATYAVTINTRNDWTITDVGGVGSVVGPPQ